MNLDLGAHPAQLGDVHVAILEDRFLEEAFARRHAHHRHELRLHVGREAGMRRGRDVHAAERARALHADVVAFAGDLDQLDHAVGIDHEGRAVGKANAADLYLKALQSERKSLWATCRLKGLARGTPERERIAVLDEAIAAQVARQKDRGKGN